MAQTKIAGLFLDPTVISGLTAITSGASDADYLFVWDATDSLLKKILPDNLGLAAAAHTIESHTATSATGTNLETLTNAGDADALHTHATKAPIAGATFTGTTQFATLSDGTIAVTAWVDEDNMSSNSATLIPTQQSVKAYVDTKAPIASPTFTTSITIGSATVDEAELEILDGATVTTTELNLLDALDRGSILYGNASGATTVLGQGGVDTVLTSDGTDIAWQAAAAGGISASQMMAYERSPEFIGDTWSHPGVAQHWISFNGNGQTIYASFNTLSLTDTNVGNWTVLLDHKFMDGNEYALVQGFTTGTGAEAHLRCDSAPATTEYYIGFFDSSNTRADPDRVYFAAFGPQNNDSPLD